MKSFIRQAAALAALVITVGCGNGSVGSGTTTTTPTNGIASISVTCPSGTCAAQTSTALTSRTLQLTANVTCNGTCNKAVTWFVNGVANGTTATGTIDNLGLFTAPTTVPTGGSVTVKALGSDNTTSGSVTVAITQAAVPVLVAYVNSALSNPAVCGNATCINDYVFDMAAPTTQTKLTTDSIYQYVSPAISPDQSTTAYIFLPNGSATAPYGAAIYTVPTKGGTPTLIRGWTYASKYMMDDIEWKPDGSAWVVSYIDETLGIAGIATVSLDGKTVTPIPVTNFACAGGCTNPPMHPRYFKDGRILYTGPGSQGNAQNFIVSADLKTKTNISNNAFNDGFGSPSLDGTQVTFGGARGGVEDIYADIYIANADGTGVIPLGQTGGRLPMWCPGNKIIFTQNSNLFSISPDGTGKVQLTTSGMSDTPYCR
jgi:hypothetical protein